MPRARHVSDSTDNLIGVTVLKNLPEILGNSLIAIEFGNDVEGNHLDRHDSNLLGHGNGPADICALWS